MAARKVYAGKLPPGAVTCHVAVTDAPAATRVNAVGETGVTVHSSGAESRSAMSNRWCLDPTRRWRSCCRCAQSRWGWNTRWENVVDVSTDQPTVDEDLRAVPTGSSVFASPIEVS
jgi:hypothetical protein